MLAWAAGPAKATHALGVVREVLLLLLHDARQLLLDVELDILDQELSHIHLLVHDGDTAFVQVAGCDQGWEEDLLELLVHEVGEGQIAEFLED